MTKANIANRIRAKKKVNADLSPSPNRKRRRVADPAKESRSQGVALFSDDENDELAPLDDTQQTNVWNSLANECNRFLELESHLDPGDQSVSSKSKLAWTQLKKSIQNAIFLMKSRRIIISKGVLRDLNLGKLLYEILPNAPEKGLVKELLKRFKEEMRRVLKRREAGLENSNTPVTEEDFKIAVERFYDAFNRVDKPLLESDVRVLAQKQAKACEKYKAKSFAHNRDTVLDRLDELTKEERLRLVRSNMQNRYWNWTNLITMDMAVLRSTLDVGLGDVVDEVSMPAAQDITPNKPTVVGGAVGAHNQAFSVFEPPKLDGLAPPEFVLDGLEAPPSASATKGKSAIEICEKEEKRRAKEMKEARKKARKEAAEDQKKMIERQKKAAKEREKKRKLAELQRRKEKKEQAKKKFEAKMKREAEEAAAKKKKEEEEKAEQERRAKHSQDAMAKLREMQIAPKAKAKSRSRSRSPKSRSRSRSLSL